jgi:uncharacterized membrane protein SpoIIM required for sporulation
LNRLVAEANGVIYGRRAGVGPTLARFFTTTFPGAVWHARRFVLVSTLCTFLPAVAVGAWIGTSDDALEASTPESVRQAYLEEDFEEYYSSEPAGQFATEVTVNNIQVSLTAFAAGVFLCLGAALLLAFNGVNVGFAAGLFVAAGEAGKFFGLILPHGLLELTAVVVAGGAGLQMGWAIIAPGPVPRGEALAEEGRRSVAIVLGLVVAFVVAGAIEGFVTGTSLDTAVRVGIGVVAWSAFLAYVVVFGRRAEASGETGLFGPPPPSWGDVRGDRSP